MSLVDGGPPYPLYINIMVAEETDAKMLLHVALDIIYIKLNGGFLCG